MRFSLTKWAGLAATLGGILGIFLTPKLTSLYGTDWDAYTAYGKLYFLSLPPELLGLHVLHKLRRGGLRTLERWGFRVLLVGMWLMAVGVFTDYWVDVPPGFLAEMVAIPPLVAGLVLLGVGLWRVATFPCWATLVMVSAGVGTLWVMFWVDHVPSGPLLLFHVTFVALGYILLSGRSVATEQPPPRVS